jgi:hypothetical protein
MQEKLLHKQHHAHDTGPGGDPHDDGPSPLLAQAQGYAQVARQAYDECERGADAERELDRRRNRSGQ